MLRVLALAAILGPTLAAPVARADRDLCARGAKHHGAPIDLDVKGADVHDVMRLLADVGHINIVVSDEVQGKVTLKLHRVAWDLVACTIAAVHKLDVTVKENVVLVRPRERR